MGIFQKAAKFLGVDKFAKGLATTGRFLSGHVEQDIQNQTNVDLGNKKVLYALKQEKDPVKKQHLQQFLQRQQFGNANTAFHKQQNFVGMEPQAGQIDPGLNLTNKEVLGSAANVALNVAMPSAFKGSKAAIVGKNALLGAGFGTAQGLEKNRSVKGIVGSAVGGGLIGGAIGVTGLLAKAAKDFVGAKVPEWMMNKAVKPALNDLRKNVKYGTDTLGKELLDEGVKGGPKKLLEIADSKLNTLEGELQATLNNPALAEARIARDQIYPELREMVSRKTTIPGGGGDLQRIKSIYNDLPEKMTLQEANEIKRSIYQELRDPAYKLDAKLGVKAETLKNIARGLKVAIEDTVGGTIVKDINHKLSIYGRLEKSMVDQLARDMRNNGLGLTDAILLSGGQTGWLALLRHLGQGTQTHIAQGLTKAQSIGTGIAGRTVKNTVKRAVLNAP